MTIALIVKSLNDSISSIAKIKFICITFWEIYKTLWYNEQNMVVFILKIISICFKFENFKCLRNQRRSHVKHKTGPRKRINQNMGWLNTNSWLKVCLFVRDGARFLFRILDKFARFQWTILSCTFRTTGTAMSRYNINYHINFHNFYNFTSSQQKI